MIGSYELILKQMDSLKYKIKLNKISDVKDALKKQINILNINYKFKSAFSKYQKILINISKLFKLSLKLIRKNNIYTLINGPISKKHF